MKTVVRNLTNNSTITLPPCFSSYPLQHNQDKDFSYTKDIPVADLASLTKLALQGKISFPGSSSILAGLPVSDLLTYVLNGQEPAGQLPGVKVWSINDNTFRTCVGSGVWSSSQINNTLVPVESWVFGDKLKSDHALNASVKMANGELLILSGKSDIFNPNPNQLVEIYNYSTNQWRYGASFPGAGRYYPLMVSLPNGKVLVAGGRDGTPFAQEIHSDFFQDSWIYDPTANTWTASGALPKKTWFATKCWTVLTNGKVLVSGGANRTDNVIDVTNPPFLAAVDCYLFDPAANAGVGAWTATGSLNTARTRHRQVLLDNGNVLAVGGQATIPALKGIGSVEVYSVSGGTWTQYAMPSITGEDFAGPGYPISPNIGGRTQMSVIKLADGRVLIAGGFHLVEVSAGVFTFNVRKSSLIFQPGTNDFATNRGPDSDSNNVDMTIARGDHSALMRTDGLVQLFCGGDQNLLPTTSCEVYDPVTDSFTSSTSMPAKKIDGTTKTPLGYLSGVETDNTAEVLPNGDIAIFANENTNFASANRHTLILKVGAFAAVPYAEPALNAGLRAAQGAWLLNTIKV